MSLRSSCWSGLASSHRYRIGNVGVSAPDQVAAIAAGLVSRACHLDPPRSTEIEPNVGVRFAGFQPNPAPPRLERRTALITTHAAPTADSDRVLEPAVGRSGAGGAARRRRAPGALPDVAAGEAEQDVVQLGALRVVERRQ